MSTSYHCGIFCRTPFPLVFGVAANYEWKLIPGLNWPTCKGRCAQPQLEDDTHTVVLIDWSLAIRVLNAHITCSKYVSRGVVYIHFFDPVVYIYIHIANHKPPSKSSLYQPTASIHITTMLLGWSYRPLLEVYIMLKDCILHRQLLVS
jgi:hypothetical protein